MILLWLVIWLIAGMPHVILWNAWMIWLIIAIIFA